MSSFFSLFADPRKAYATLAPDIAGADDLALQHPRRRGHDSVHRFDLAGGGNIAGSNVLVGGAGGQLDFLTTAGYNQLGLPGNMIPNSSVGVGNFIDHDARACDPQRQCVPARHQAARARSTTMDNVNGAVMPAISQTDTNYNPHNPMYGIHSAGAAGDLLVLIGTEAHDLGRQFDGAVVHDRPDRATDHGVAGLGRDRAGEHRLSWSDC